MTQQIKTSAIVMMTFVLITGLAYPLLITGMAQWLFPFQANGSLIMKGDKVTGSALIGQAFDDPKYFWGRPSTTANYPYNASSSRGSNLGSLNPSLIGSVYERIHELQKSDPENNLPIPIDLVTSSASGLDPDISPAAARYQTTRIASLRGKPIQLINDLIDQYTQKPMLGFLGEQRVNVLSLNLALDAIQ
jgi:potassium-transporting ATPase KdpC subunit